MEKDLIELIKNLKCNKCKLPLSVPPIICDDSEGTICGRCIDSLEPNAVKERQLIFESLAQVLEFSCKYSSVGCDSKLKWGEVVEHEKSCPFGMMTCIYDAEEFKSTHDIVCQWRGRHEQYFQHVEDAHSEYLDKKLEINLIEEPGSRFIFTRVSTQQAGYILLAVFLYDKLEEAYFTLIITEDKYQKLFKFQIKILEENRKAFICLNESVASLLPFSSENVRKNGQKIKISTIYSIITPKYLSIHFEHESMGEKLEKKLREYKICDMCKEILTYPIYSCSKKHNFCKNCYETEMECPVSTGENTLCNDELFKRNIRLEIENTLPYVCNEGCSFKGSIIEFEFHQKICTFKTRKCTYRGCVWTGPHLSSHILECHSGNVLYMKRKNKLALNFPTHWLFPYENQFFYLSTKNDTNQLSFSICCENATEIEFKYNIEVSSPNSPYINISFCHVVQPEVISNLSETIDYIIIPKSLLKELHFDDAELEFSLDISRIE